MLIDADSSGWWVLKVTWLGTRDRHQMDQAMIRESILGGSGLCNLEQDLPSGVDLSPALLVAGTQSVRNSS